MNTCDTKYNKCLYYSSNALSRVMSKMADEEFSVFGLSTSYAFLLMTVNEAPGIHPKEISRAMQLSPSTVTRLIEKMEAKCLLERKYVGRATEVYPTKESEEMTEKIVEVWENLYKKYSKVLGVSFTDELTENITLAIEKLK